MKEKILQALKTRFASLGLSAEVLEGVASQLAVYIKEEAGIELAVAGAEPMLKSMQSFADSRVGNIKTEAERLKAENEAKARELEELKKGKPGEPKPGENPELKAIMDKLASLETTVTGFTQERNTQTLSQKLTGILAEKKIPESFYKVAIMGRQFKDETEITAIAEQISSGFEVHKQELANQGFQFTTPPEGGEKPKGDASEIASLIDTGTKQIVEQQKN